MKSDYDHVAAAFDRIAGDYAAVYGPEGNAAMTWMRHENLQLLQSTFAPGSRLLEIGCGAGEEAVALAQAGYTVLATDISPGMASATQARAIQAGVAARVQVVALPAGFISELRPVQPFDGGYASFGALNCEPALPAVGAALARLIRPGGLFITSIMGRTSLFEMVWYSLHAQPRRAFRRFREGWQLAPVAGKSGREIAIPTRYLTVRQLTEAFPAFSLESLMALPLLLPPPYADSLYRRYPHLCRWLEQADRRLRKRVPWRTLGDHTILVLQRLQAHL
ncbi:MAG: class I SAM-dependent methyltransferase [Anaerolineae bacterium]|nr:class I SAM-dependent methyltransferase [Anaerolineae bacterium]